MTGVKIISESLEETLKGSDLQSVSVDLVEVLSDSLINDGLLKDIPIIGTVVGLSKTAFSISGLLLLKKMIYFLSELDAVSLEKRRSMIEQINSSKRFKMRVGEKLLYIINKCADHENAQFVAKLFVGFLENEIDYPDFLRAEKLIEQIYIGDLIQFIEDDRNVLKLDEIGKYEGSGLYVTYTENIRVVDQDDWKRSDKYIVEGGETNWYTTDTGSVIRKVLKKRI